MARPTDAGSFAEAVYALMEPVQFDEEALDYPLLRYLAAIGQMFQQLHSLIDDPYTVWSSLVDINRMGDEALPWFGQLVGVSVDTTLEPAAQRQQIRNHDSWARGTVPSISKAIRGVVGDDVSFQINERDGSAWQLEVLVDIDTGEFTYQRFYDNNPTYTSLMSEWFTYQIIYNISTGNAVLDPIRAAINAQKPAGIVLTVAGGAAVPKKISIYETNRTYDQLWNAWEAYEYIYSYYYLY